MAAAAALVGEKEAAPPRDGGVLYTERKLSGRRGEKEG